MKLNFRSRTILADRYLKIYYQDELDNDDLNLNLDRQNLRDPKFNNGNGNGMELDEFKEHHLQKAISNAGSVIPTPDVYEIQENEIEYYDKLYPENYKLPRQLIYMQPFSMEADIPDYDMDSEDEVWVNSQASKLVDLTPDKFEEMMDRLEKGSGQTVVTLQEAKALIKEDDDLIIAVYDYWLTKRLAMGKDPLIPHVKTEARQGISNHNPYIAFRRRTEKMQTRKNRKNDESSYEKMLKLKRDLTRAVTLLEMVKRREKSKRELLHLTIEVFEKRYLAGDFSGQIVNEVLSSRPARPAFTLFQQPNNFNWIKDPQLVATLSRKEKRHYKKKRHKSSNKSHIPETPYAARYTEPYMMSSEEEGDGVLTEEEEEEDEGPFHFRRKLGCDYHEPIEGNYEWAPPSEGGPGSKKYGFYPTSISVPTPGSSSNPPERKYRYAGYCRRRVGRGGRVILERMAYPKGDEYWKSLERRRRGPEPLGYPSDEDDSFNSTQNDVSDRLNPTPAPQPPLPTPSTSSTCFPFPPPHPPGPIPSTSASSILPQPSSSSWTAPPIYIKQEPLTGTIPTLPTPPPPVQIPEEDLEIEETNTYAYTTDLDDYVHFRPKTPECRSDEEKRRIEEQEEKELSNYLLQRRLASMGPVHSALGQFLCSRALPGEQPTVFNVDSLLADPLILSNGQNSIGGASTQLLDESTAELTNAQYFIDSEGGAGSEFMDSELLSSSPIAYEILDTTEEEEERSGFPQEGGRSGDGDVLMEDGGHQIEDSSSSTTPTEQDHPALPPPPPTTGSTGESDVLLVLDNNNSTPNSSSEVNGERRSSVDEKENETSSLIPPLNSIRVR